MVDGRSVGEAWRPDARVVFRTDDLGARIGVLPATCRSGQHSLFVTGYTTRMSGKRLPQVACTPCTAARPPRPDSTWSLLVDGPPPDRAELDDEPYADLLPGR
jgi:hypothetical protein